MTTLSPIEPTAPLARYQTAADWVRDLGDVPLERIIFNPRPGFATEDDAIRKIDAERQLCELVEGTLVEKGTGFVESMIALKLSQLLLTFVDARRLGVVAGESGPIRLARGLVRIPDVSFISFSRFPGGKLPRESLMPIAPDLAVEVLSKSNTPRELDRKTAEYFRAGVSAVWLIDPETRSARVYNDPSNAEQVGANGVLRGAGVLQGFEVSLAELFAVIDDAR